MASQCFFGFEGTVALIQAGIEFNLATGDGCSISGNQLLKCSEGKMLGLKKLQEIQFKTTFNIESKRHTLFSLSLSNFCPRL